MKKVSTIFCFVEAIVRAVGGFIYLIVLTVTTNNKAYSTCKSGSYFQECWDNARVTLFRGLVGYWIVWVVLVGLAIGALVYRYNALEDEKKVESGIVTMIFASFVGGILTLCIPEDDL